MRRAVIVMLVVAACGTSRGPETVEEAPIPEAPADAIVTESSQGAATVTVKVWPAKPTLGDSIWLQIEGKVEDGVTLEMPFDQTALGRFQVLRYASEDGRDTYELAAPMSGKHRIPPMRVVVHDRRSGTGSEIEILTEEIPIDVGTVLAEKTDRELAPSKGTMETEVGGRTWWPIIAFGGGVLALATGIVVWLMLRDRAVRRSKISAWEMAMQRLADLEARGAPGADEADGWFVELSTVVRRYIEGRFRLRAPELTTEEFLLEARRMPELSDAHRAVLAAFLEQCDRVKFAGWRPDAEASLAVLEEARSFIADSRPREESAPAPVRAPIAEVVS